MKLRTKPTRAERDAKVAIGIQDRRRKYAERIRSAELAVAIPDPANPRRREACSKSLEKFLRSYFPAEFPHRFDRNMKQVINMAEKVITTGGLFSAIMPRGSGKTTVLCRAALWGTLTGKRPFLVILAATEPAAARLLQMLMVDLASNELLRADFPEVAAPFAAGEGRPQRLRALHHEGTTLHCNATRDRIIFPSLDRPGSVAAGQVIVSRGLTGALRGITHTQPNGVTIRPSCVLIDDPQSDDSARSAQQTADRESLISGAVLGLAGPKQTVAALVALTCIKRNDLAERLHDPKQHPEFTGCRFALVETWPTSPRWEEYDALWQGDSPRAATAYYRKHRKEMDEGAIIPCTWRIRPGEISALQTARNLRLEMGEAAFASEMQGQPPDIEASQYSIDVPTVISHTIDLPRLHIPPAATVMGGHADINRRGLHWTIAAFDQQMSAHVTAYGKHPRRGDLWPENATDYTRQTAIFRGSTELCQQITGTQFVIEDRPARLDILLIDASFESDTVHRFAEQARFPFRVIPAIGRAAHRYRWRKDSLVGRPMEGCHMQRPQNRRCPYVMFNSDQWRETMQRAFLGVPGEPGGCTIHHADNPKAHIPYAEHIVAEKLINKYATDLGTRWEWQATPGSIWDWGDTLTGCYVAAAMAGLSTSGAIARPARNRKRRRIRHVQI